MPPESTATTGVANAFGWSSTAATAAAPAGSTTIFARSSSITSAREMESSETVTMSSTYFWIEANGTSPGQATAMPSAIVVICSTASGSPRRSDSGYAAASSACTPDDAHVGSQPLDRGRDAREQPAASRRDQHGGGLGGLLEDLEAGRALAGHDVGVVEGVDQDGTGLVGERLGGDEGLGEVLTGEAHLGAVPPGGVGLRDRLPPRA